VIEKGRLVVKKKGKTLTESTKARRTLKKGQNENLCGIKKDAPTASRGVATTKETKTTKKEGLRRRIFSEESMFA